MVDLFMYRDPEAKKAIADHADADEAEEGEEAQEDAKRARRERDVMLAEKHVWSVAHSGEK